MKTTQPQTYASVFLAMDMKNEDAHSATIIAPKQTILRGLMIYVHTMTKYSINLVMKGGQHKGENRWEKSWPWSVVA